MSAISRVIIYTNSKELSRLLGDAFLVGGISSMRIKKCLSADTVVKTTARSGLNYEVLSEDLGYYELNQVLERVSVGKTHSMMNILLIADGRNSRVSRLAIEYGVNQVIGERYSRGPSESR